MFMLMLRFAVVPLASSQRATATLGLGATASLGFGASLEPSAVAAESQVGASLLAEAQEGTLGGDPTPTMDLLAGLHDAAQVPPLCPNCTSTLRWS